MNAHKWMRNVSWSMVLALAGGLGAQGQALAGWPGRVVTRPPCRCGVPSGHPYRTAPRRATALVPSRVVVPLLRTGAQLVEEQTEGALFPSETAARTTERLPKNTLRLYQMPQARIRLDHCELSRVSLLVDGRGRWWLSLRADQNRRGLAEEHRRPGLKRNRFRVVIRCYAFTGQDDTLEAGSPVLEELGPFEFWVQQGEPYIFSRRGRLFEKMPAEVTRLLQQIDRVELEFSYH